MDRVLLNEHDANQGAQSRGEFLGMTGNSGWYLLGSIGVSLLIVILCWGVLGISLLLCLLVGVALCGLSLAYVFALKNNRPEHYDTDFFESALIDASVVELAFGPRLQRLPNPFAEEEPEETAVPEPAMERRATVASREHPAAGLRKRSARQPSAEPAVADEKRNVRKVDEPVVPLAAYEQVREDLDLAEEMLEDALSEPREG